MPTRGVLMPHPLRASSGDWSVKGLSDRLMSGERVAQGELLPLSSHGPYHSEGIGSALEWTR